MAVPSLPAVLLALASALAPSAARASAPSPDTALPAPTHRLASVDAPAESAVLARVHSLLEAYARNDVDAVLALIDADAFTIYGSDVAEYFGTPAELRTMMANDFALWRTARFGELADVSVRVSGDLATAFFHVPFSAGGRPPVTVRFSTVWRRHAGEWRLTQSANTVPTTGSSATELLRGLAKR